MGISRLPASKRKSELQTWLEYDLIARFGQRIVAARQWGRIRAEAQRAGRPLPVIDCLIAAIALVHNMTIVTCNVGDMTPTGVLLSNPWDLEGQCH